MNRIARFFFLYLSIFIFAIVPNALFAQIIIEYNGLNSSWFSSNGTNLSTNANDCNPDSTSETSEGMTDSICRIQTSDVGVDGILEQLDMSNKFSPDFTASGYYKVYYTNYTNTDMCSRILLEIEHEGQKEYMLNTQYNASGACSGWQLLGSWYFNSASDGFLSLFNQHQLLLPNSPGYCAGDAAKFVLSDNTPAPDEWQNFDPSGITIDKFPDCTIEVRDTDGGLKANSARFRYSCNGGSTWSLWLGRHCIWTKYSSNNSLALAYPEIYNSDCATGSYSIVNGDKLHYDIYLVNSDTRGAIDLQCHDSSVLRDSGLTDQNGYGAHADTDLSQFTGKWYHREFNISMFQGKRVKCVQAAHETEGPSKISEFYLRNIFIENAGTVKLYIYGDDPMANFKFPNDYIHPGIVDMAQLEFTTIADPSISFDAVTGSTNWCKMTVTDVPFNGYSSVNYKIMFRASDVSDNIGNSSQYLLNIVAPTNTPTSTPTNTPTRTPSNTPTGTPTNTPTNTPSNTPTITPTDTPSNTPTNTSVSTNTPTMTPTNTPTNTLTDTPSNTPTNTPTNTMTGAPTNTPTVALLHSLIGHWSMDSHNSTTLFDDSTRGNDLVKQGNVQFDQPGFSGVSSGFPNANSNDYFSISDIEQNELDDLSSVSCIAWIYKQFSLGTQGTICAKWTSDDTLNMAYAFLVDANQKLKLLVSSGPASQANVVSAGSVSSDEWIHVAGVVSAEKFTVYINGIESFGSASGSFPGNIANDNSDFTLGRMMGSSPSPWKGFIDEVFLYSRAITEDEVLVIMSGLPTVTPISSPTGSEPTATVESGINSYHWQLYK